jgi:hypothetical protein
MSTICSSVLPTNPNFFIQTHISKMTSGFGRAVGAGPARQPRRASSLDPVIHDIRYSVVVQSIYEIHKTSRVTQCRRHFPTAATFCSAAVRMTSSATRPGVSAECTHACASSKTWRYSASTGPNVSSTHARNSTERLCLCSNWRQVIYCNVARTPPARPGAGTALDCSATLSCSVTLVCSACAGQRSFAAQTAMPPHRAYARAQAARSTCHDARERPR